MEVVDVRGRFVWHQLLTRDVPAVKKFYPRIAGWQTQAWPLDPNYTVCHAAGVPTAGMMAFTNEVPAEAPSHWLQYIGTRDVDGTADNTVRLGGSIVKEPAEMRGAGRYAVLRDPQGAVFAVIDPENARAEVEGRPPLGQFSWHELATSDHEAAFAFYNNLFGWDAISRMDLGPMGIYLIFGQRGEQRGGIYIKPPDMPSPPHWLPYLHVTDVDQVAPAAEAAGGKLINGPMDVPGGSRIAMMLDPAGAAFALHAFPKSAIELPAQSAAASTPGEGSMSGRARKRPVAAKAKKKAKAKSAASARKKARGTSRVMKRAKVKAKVKAKAKTKAKTKAKASPRKKAARRKK